VTTTVLPTMAGAAQHPRLLEPRESMVTATNQVDRQVVGRAAARAPRLQLACPAAELHPMAASAAESLFVAVSALAL